MKTGVQFHRSHFPNWPSSSLTFFESATGPGEHPGHQHLQHDDKLAQSIRGPHQQVVVHQVILGRLQGRAIPRLPGKTGATRSTQSGR